MGSISFNELKDEIVRQGPHLFFDEQIILNMEELPAGIKSITVKNGGIISHKLILLPDDISIEAEWTASFFSLIRTGSNVSITADKNINLPKVRSIGKNIAIKSNWGSVWLDNLTTITEIIKIDAALGMYFQHMDVGLKSLTLTGCSVPNELFQILAEKDICLQCKATSSLANLALMGIKIEIVS